MNKIITAGLGKLDWRDLLHGLYVAVGASVSVPLLEWLNALQAGKVLVLDYKTIAITAAGAAIGYLIKRFLTPAQVITTATQSQIAAK